MSYYQGDFYSGDPFFGGILRAIGGVAKGFLGIPSKAPKLALGTGVLAPMMAKLPKPVAGVMTRAGTMIAKHPVLTAAGAAGTIGVLGGAATTHPVLSGMGAMAAGRGMHMSKRTGKMVRNRRMRVTNVRALRRAIRRCTGFAHLAKRVLRFTSPRPPRGRAVFKHRRRTKRV